MAVAFEVVFLTGFPLAYRQVSVAGACDRAGLLGCDREPAIAAV